METYLGDGVYALYDRGMIKLTTTERTEEGHDVAVHTIYLEQEVLANLIMFAKAQFGAETWSKIG